MRIEVDRSRCQGHGLCSLVDEALFPLDDEGYTALDDVQEIAPENGEKARTGSGACPERALRLIG